MSEIKKTVLGEYSECALRVLKQGPQSSGHNEQVSPAEQIASPQAEEQAPQSQEHVEQSSFEEHKPSPQEAVAKIQHFGKSEFEQV